MTAARGPDSSRGGSGGSGPASSAVSETAGGERPRQTSSSANALSPTLRNLLYSSITVSGSSRIAIRPSCIQMISVQSLRSAFRPWLTMKIVPACEHSSRILSNDLRLKRASPTESASSMSRMSGSMFTATEKASRPYIPDEYVRIGRSTKSPSSANSAISSYFAASCARVSPAASPPSTTFSRPLSWALKPTPSASSVLTRPCTSTRPSVGGRMPATVRISVDFPAPLTPTIPSTAPCGASKETSRTASMSRTVRSRLPSRRSVPLSVGCFSNVVLYVTERFSTLTAQSARCDGGASTAIPCSLEADGKLSLPRDEEEGADQERAGGPREAPSEGREAGRLSLVDDVAQRAEHGRQRVRGEDRVEPRGNLVDVVEDRGGIEPDPHEVRQEVPHVAEVHLDGCDEHGRSRGEDDEKGEDGDRPEEMGADRQPDAYVQDAVDDERRKEAHARRQHGREREEGAREGRVEDETSAADD